MVNMESQRQGKREDPDIFCQAQRAPASPALRKLADGSLGKSSGEESESGDYYQDYFATARRFTSLTSQNIFSFALRSPRPE
jgi:hypothetical protein